MKKRLTKILSLFLATLMLLSVMSVGIFNLNASDNTKAKLDAFITSYPNGSRWTGSFDGGIQCYGFGKMVIYNLFGKSNSTYRTWTYSCSSVTGMNVIDSLTSFGSSNVKSLLSNAQCGDVLQFNTPKQHTMIVYGVDSDGVWIYDCNWDNNCGISLRKSSFGAWSSRNSTKLTLLRATGSDVCNCSTSYAGNYICTTSSLDLTIRSGHGSSYSAIGSIPPGATVTVSKANGSWAHVTYNGTSGYASMEYLQIKEHTHTYVGPYFEKSHPHKKYMSCSASGCDKYYYTGENAATYADPYYEAAHPHRYYRECTVSGCDGYEYTGKYASVKTCSSCWYATFDLSATSISVKVGETKAISATINGFWPDTVKAVSDYDTSIIDVTVGQNMVTFKGLKPGTCTFKMIVYSDSSKSHIIGSKSIPVTVEAATVTKVVSTLPSKTSYYIGDSFDPTGIKLTVTYSDGTVKTVTSGFTTSGFSSSTAGTKTVTVSYGGKSTTFTVKVLTPAIIINASKKTLKIGESFTATAITDPSGKTASWKTGNTSIATVSNGKITAVGEGTVSIYASFTYNGIKYETKMSVIVEKPEVVLNSISIKSTPNKAVYYIGDTINTDGLAITAKYSDGSTKTITNGLTISGFSSTSAGTKTVTVSYGGKSTTFTVKVTTPTISINTSGKTLKIGESVTVNATTTPTGQTVTWKSGNTNIATVSNGKVTAVGEGSVSIYASITYNGIKYETKTSVTVEEPEVILNSISIKSTPNKTVYYIGDTINTNGLEITAKYSDGTTKTITNGFSVSGFDSSSKGMKTVAVSYGGKTTPFEVTVKSPSVMLALESKSLTVGDQYTLSVSSDPENVELMWSSYDANIATVSNGKVTAKAEGEVIIKAKFTYNGITYSDTCTIKITDTGCKHKYTTVYDAVDSTCTTQGHGKYIVCDDCKMIISGSDELLPLKDHIPGEYVVTREPTYNIVGIEACFCTECGKQLDRKQIPVLEYTNKFTDVKSSHWFWESVNYVARKGFMSGMSETKFSPNTELTREQFIQILFAMEGKDKSEYSGETGFNDVGAGKWYSPAIKWAKQEGVTDGIGNGKFGLGANVTREQMAKFMMSFAEYKNYNTDGRSDISYYKDVNKVSAWAKEAMQWCVSTGIYDSTSATEMKLEPRIFVKRSVAATVIMRFVQATGK